jgi:predicted metal-dependent hydrolase
MTNSLHHLMPVDDIVAVDLFKAEVRGWAARIGVDVKQIHVRAMRRKWASASSSGRLTFDSALLKEPQNHRNEVIVHELVHLKVGNHGSLFRHLVRAYLED